MEEKKEEKKEEIKEVKKVENSKAICIIIIVLLLVLIGSVAAWYLLSGKNKDISSNQIISRSGNNEINNNTIENMVIAETEQEEKVEDDIEQSEESKKEETNESSEKQEKKESENKKQETNSQKNNSQETKKQEEKKTETTNTETSKSDENKKTEETIKPVEQPKPTKTGTDTTKELTKTETKYGVVTNTYTITTYDVYSDGSKVEKSKKTETEYDNSGYSATTAELLPEARQIKSQNASKINEVLKYVNEYRKEANENAVGGVTERKDLVLDSDLTVAACARAMEMAYTSKMTHTRPNGSSCFTILKDMGIKYYSCAENIAEGQTTAKSVANSWKNSSGHYSNMINQDYGKIGIGVINYRGRNYWVQLFTN